MKKEFRQQRVNENENLQICLTLLLLASQILLLTMLNYRLIRILICLLIPITLKLYLKVIVKIDIIQFNSVHSVTFPSFILFKEIF